MDREAWRAVIHGVEKSRTQLSDWTELNWKFGMCFPDGSDGKASACNAGDLGLIPGLGRSPGEGNGSPLQYSCLENSMDRGAWWALWGRKELDMTEWLTLKRGTFTLKLNTFHILFTWLWQSFISKTLQQFRSISSSLKWPKLLFSLWKHAPLWAHWDFSLLHNWSPTPEDLDSTLLPF